MPHMIHNACIHANRFCVLTRVSGLAVRACGAAPPMPRIPHLLPVHGRQKQKGSAYVTNRQGLPTRTRVHTYFTHTHLHMHACACTNTCTNVCAHMRTYLGQIHTRSVLTTHKRTYTRAHTETHIYNHSLEGEQLYVANWLRWH
jgi:hypothetical protein